MKPAVLAQRLFPLMPMLRCPRCASPFRLTDQSLVCEQNHCYDLSKRGYVNLAPNHDQEAEKYGTDLFESRRIVFEGGFYQPVLEQIAAHLSDEPLTVLDVGCGEGWYARMLSQAFPQAQFLGLDISRDAITAAARTQSSANWLVADLKHLPVADHSVDVLLDVLTPADYAEFARVLKPGGKLIKVIPGTDYLCEVRRAVAPWLRNGGSYDNAQVMEHLKQHAKIISANEISTPSPLTAQQSHAFLRMTPMTFSVPEEVLSTLALETITIHMHVLCCTFE
ncbi:MAG: methyltransferase domain-containing protein [Clostridia bacterium]|nr:methyltransferase domain-containing protein [Clostridia bacterium]